MDRLHPLIPSRKNAVSTSPSARRSAPGFFVSPPVLLVLTGLIACEGGGAPAPAGPAPSRVDSVAAQPKKAVNLDSFCETGRKSVVPLQYPATDEPAPATTGGWTWVNVWATWCGPCIEEMPTIQKWEARLASEGAPIRVQLMSADEQVTALQGFKAKHPDWPSSLHMTDAKALEAWTVQSGLGTGPVLPIHLFVDPQGQIRCSKMGALSPTDYEAIKAVVQGG